MDAIKQELEPLSVNVSKYPYLFTEEGIPVTLRGWSVGADPSEWAKAQDGFRICFGEEAHCASRSDILPVFKSLEAAVEAVLQHKEAREDAGAGEEYTLPYIKGFVFGDNTSFWQY